MISIHALSMLVLALALALVLICAAIVYLEHRSHRALAVVSARLDALDAKAGEGR